MTRRDSTPGDEETKVVAPRFDERESATARPVVPIDPHDGKANGRRATARRSLSAYSRHLILAWAVVATLAAGAFALYRGGETNTPEVATPQPSPEETTASQTPVTPQPAARRNIPIAPARRAGVTEVRSLLPSRPESDWQHSEEGKRDGSDDEEELDKRARKEEKRRRKEEEKRREEAEEDAERAMKEARKKAERLRDKLKDESRKSRLVGVIS